MGDEKDHRELDGYKAQAEELLKEFNTKFRDEVESASRPYAFIKFDTFIQRTKKLYVDTRTQRNLNKLNDDLTSVRDIMTQNIQGALGRGEALDSVAGKSDKLRGASKIYVSQARYLNTQALLRKYAPLAFVLMLVLGMFWWRFR